MYDVSERGELRLSSDDIFIGHAWPDFNTKTTAKNKWSTFDPEQITNSVVLRYPNDERVFMIGPFNTDADQIGWSLPLLAKTKNFIGICGDRWVRDLEDVFPVFRQCQFHHLNMALDPRQYPMVKRKFNPKGKRKFLYVGRVSQEKGTDMLAELASRSPGFHCGYISSGRINSCVKIADQAIFTVDYVKNLVNEYDYFLSFSTYDAQATTVLEAMSWGLGIACTPESGYEHESIFELSTADLAHNLKAVETMQSIDEERLTNMQKANLQLLNQKYSWDIFRDKLIKIINN